MTGTAGLLDSTVTSSTGPGSKPPSSKTENKPMPDGFELAAFSELFFHLESEDSPTETEAPLQEDQLDSEAADEAVMSLQLEATHNEWFGAEIAQKESEPLDTRTAPPLIVKKEPTDELPSKEELSTPPPPLFDGDLPEPPRQERSDQTDAYGLAALPVAPPVIQPIVQATTKATGQAAAQTTMQATAPAIVPPTAKQPTASTDQRLKRVTSSEIEDILTRNDPLPNDAARLPASPPPMAKPQAISALSIRADVQASLSALEKVLSSHETPAPETSVRKAPTQNTPAAPADKGNAPEGIVSILKDAGISAIRQETYLPPGFAQTPTFQIAQRIAHEAQIGRSSQAASGDIPAQPEKPLVRVLQIQLNPPQLGPLTIRMSIKDDALNLQLEATKYETAQLIHHDKEALSNLLRSAGYLVDGLNVQFSAPERGPGGQPHNAPGGGFGQGSGQQPGSRQPEGQASYGGWQGSSEGDAQRPGRQQPGPPQTGRARGGYYL